MNGKYFFHCLDNLFRYSISKLLSLKKVNFSTLNWLLPFGGFWGRGERGHLFQENKATDV